MTTPTDSLFADSLKSLFHDTDALIKGHFELSSGLHSDQYLQCALVLSHPAHAAMLGEELTHLLPTKPDVVLSPAIGGLIIGHEVARAFGTRALFAEREKGEMTLRRGFALSPKEKVVIVEDVVTTGKSSGEVIALARARQAEVLGVLSIICRAKEIPGLDGVPVHCLLHLPIPVFKPADCPLCRQNRPLTKPGSRKLEQAAPKEGA